MRELELGDTPLLPLPGLGIRGRVSLKAEFRSRFGSIKDRTAAYLLAWAVDCAGPQVWPVESTSGNLGVAMARIGRHLGIRTTLVMDASLPRQRVAEVQSLGAEVVLVSETATHQTLRERRIAEAIRLGRAEGRIWLNQYGNPAGLRAHQETTGAEIIGQAKGELDAVVASVGTGGTVCGIGAALQELPHPPMLVAVEPAGSTIFGGADGDYLPAGAGMRGTPDIMRQFGHIVDEFAQVPDYIAAHWALRVRAMYGLEVGQTTGAAVAVAAHLAERDGGHVVAVAPDRGATFHAQMRQLAAKASATSGTESIQVHKYIRDFSSSTVRPRS